MDFIERILGISPDGGSGTLEFLLFAVPLMAMATPALLRHAYRRRKVERCSPQGL